MRQVAGGGSIPAMSSMRRPSTAVLAAAAVCACALPAAASAAPSACLASLPGPGGGTWDVRTTGDLERRLLVGDDRAFGVGHGRMVVGGTEFPAVGGVSCEKTANTLTFPTRTLNGFQVQRSISVIDGRLRHLDTFKNVGAQTKNVKIRWNIEIGEAQKSVTTESGDMTASGKDDWMVLQDDGLYPVLQWGIDGNAVAQQGRTRPEIVTPEEVEFWNPTDFGSGDESARFDYDTAVLAGETVRFLHVTDAATSQAAALTAAKDSARTFGGYSKALAKTVVNYGPDPDKDGVPVGSDDCPSVTGDQANGCLLLVAKPVDPADPTPPAGDPIPAPTPDPAPGTGPGGTPSPTDPGTTPGGGAVPTGDRTGPKVSISRLASRIRRGRLQSDGLAPRIRCSEACTLNVRVVGLKKRARNATTFVTVKRTPASAGSRDLRLKVRRARLANLRRAQVTVVVVATDRAGNRTRVSRLVRLRR